jgi:hypothetical protein
MRESLDIEYEGIFVRILDVFVERSTVWFMGVFGPSGLDIPILGPRRDGSLGEKSRNSEPWLSCLRSESIEMLVEGFSLKWRDRERDIRQHGALRGVESITRIQFYEDGDPGSADNSPAARSLFPTAPLLNDIAWEHDKLSFLVQIPSVPGMSQSLYWRANLTNTLFFVGVDPDEMTAGGELVPYAAPIQKYLATFIHVQDFGKY